MEGVITLDTNRRRREEKPLIPLSVLSDVERSALTKLEQGVVEEIGPIRVMVSDIIPGEHTMVTAMDLVTGGNVYFDLKKNTLELKEGTGGQLKQFVEFIAQNEKSAAA